MLDRTNTGSAGADEANASLKPKVDAPRRRSKRAAPKCVEPHGADGGTSDERAHASRGTPPCTSPLVATNSDAGAQVANGIHDQASSGIGAQFDGGALQTQANHDQQSPAVEPLNLVDDRALTTPEIREERSPIIDEVVQLWRMRQRWHRAEKSLILQGKAICRSYCEGDKERANALFHAAETGEAGPVIQIATFRYIESQRGFEHDRKAIEKRLRKLAHELPIWPWVKNVRGFGDLNFAALVGECGDIGSYRNPSCLWKRMGLAVIDGGRQRKVADADAALVHGYNPSRRAVAWNLGECLVKAAGPYKEVYNEHKAKQSERDGMKPIIAHRRAARYMTKRVLRDLWVAWRGSSAA